MVLDFTIGFSLYDVCTDTYTPIYSIQGSCLEATITGSISTEGVVVGDYDGPSPTLRGFYIQDATGDGDPATSDGVFVFNGNNDNVNFGDGVRDCFSLVGAGGGPIDVGVAPKGQRWTGHKILGQQLAAIDLGRNIVSGDAGWRVTLKSHCVFAGNTSVALGRWPAAPGLWPNDRLSGGSSYVLCLSSVQPANGPGCLPYNRVHVHLPVGGSGAHANPAPISAGRPFVPSGGRVALVCLPAPGRSDLRLLCPCAEPDTALDRSTRALPCRMRSSRSCKKPPALGQICPSRSSCRVLISAAWMARYTAVLWALTCPVRIRPTLTGPQPRRRATTAGLTQPPILSRPR